LYHFICGGIVNIKKGGLMKTYFLLSLLMLISAGKNAISICTTCLNDNVKNADMPAASAEMMEDTMNKNTIVDIAVADSKFSTLVDALKAADLVSTLSGEKVFTVFAPTNEAFAKIPKGELDALLADKAKLAKVLTYHVVPGKVTASEVVKLADADTVEGRKVTFTVKGGKVFVNNAEVVKADVDAKNGVIHVIDTVLIPE